MRKVIKTEQNNRISAILSSKSGASIVLVAIIAILVISAVVVLRITTGALWATADKQLNYDQAYEMATSFGDSLDVLIIKEKAVNLQELCSSGGIIYSDSSVSSLPNAKIDSKVTAEDDGVYVVTVESRVATASYIYRAKYRGAGTNYTRVY